MGSDEFVDYYAAQSLNASTMQRFGGIRDAVGRAASHLGVRSPPWRVADIGCGAATQCVMWAKDGHDVFGLDINSALIELGQRRAVEAAVKVDLRVGSATALPWESRSMDIVLCPELLEHVPDWSSVLAEACRVLAPSGILYLSTTNRLCPRQQEFDLPFYSWYPAPLKRHFERLAVTTRPELVQHAKWPAVHWFTFYGLRRVLASSGLKCFDRFDVAALADRSVAGRAVLSVIRSTPATRFMGHVLTPYTMVLAQRTSG